MAILHGRNFLGSSDCCNAKAVIIFVSYAACVMLALPITVASECTRPTFHSDCSHYGQYSSNKDNTL